MDSVRQYILSVVAAASICGFFSTLFSNKNTFGGIVKLLTGLFLTITVISPIAKVNLRNYAMYFDDLTVEAEDAASYGSKMAEDSMRTIIKSQTEAYILDKANALGLNLSVEVILDDADSLTPCAITLNGVASPYAKARLQQYIVQDLGIPKESQEWT